MKIIIVGAGIAGLTLGLACQAMSMQVKIVDKTKALNTIGGGILLWPHGVSCLDRLGLWEKLKPVCMSATCMNLYGHLGNLLLREDHADLYDLMNGEIYPLDRSVMQQRLAAELNHGVLELGKACQSVESHSDYARIIYADGTEETADLIVGADGVHSVVRQAVSPESVPVYSGTCWWGGMVDRLHVPHFSANEVHFIMGQGKLCSVWPAHNNRFMWYLPVKMPLESFSSAEGQQQAEAICKDWHPDVMRLVTAPQSAQRFHVPIYQVAPPKQISAGRLVLIGDAACVYGPLLGQGVNKAIEDTFVLSQLLQQHPQSIPDALLPYHPLRAARHQRFYELEQMAADSLMHDEAVTLRQFEAAVPEINLAMMYQDVIPLVNRVARSQLMGVIENLTVESI